MESKTAYPIVLATGLLLGYGASQAISRYDIGNSWSECVLRQASTSSNDARLVSAACAEYHSPPPAVSAVATEEISTPPVPEKPPLPDLSQIPPWRSIASSNKFQSLSQEEQRATKLQYFDEALAPHVGSFAPVVRERFMALRYGGEARTETIEDRAFGWGPAQSAPDPECQPEKFPVAGPYLHLLCRW